MSRRTGGSTRRASARRAAALAAFALGVIAAAAWWPGPATASSASRPAVHAAAAHRVGRSDSLLASPTEYLGWKYFHVYCYRCHGVDAIGGQLAPDLRASVSPQGSIKHDDFVHVVKEGRLAKGMPAWSSMLSDEQIEGLYAYVKARSDGRLAAGRPRLAGTK